MPLVPIRDGVALSVLDDGPRDAPALVLITGLGGLKEGWFRQVPEFSRDFRVIAHDHRGMGGSTSTDDAFTLRDLADDVVRLLDALDVPTAAVWGVSMGGKVAQELAIGWPDRVSALILENTSAGEVHRVEGPLESPLRRMQGADADRWLTDIVPLLFGEAYRAANPGSMRAFARSRERHPPDPGALARQWAAYERFDSWDRLPQIAAPTLCLAGAEDNLCDPRNANALAARIPGARAVSIPGGGHSVHIELPDAVNAAVRAFLAAADP
jgi:pimeloyl-ACP methyl ester carboxylesterase